MSCSTDPPAGSYTSFSRVSHWVCLPLPSIILPSPPGLVRVPHPVPWHRLVNSAGVTTNPFHSACPQMHRPLSYQVQPLWPVRSTPTLQAWTMDQDAHPTHQFLSTWLYPHQSHFQHLGPIHLHIFSFAPTCSLHIRLRTNQRNLHTKITLQKYK